MPSQELKIPDHFINRFAERESFEKLLQLQDDARLLAIEDKEGTGKSTLLKMLRYQCFYVYGNPVSILSFEESTINSPFVFIERLRKGFGTKLKFAHFDALNQARVNKLVPSFVGSPSVTGAVYAQGSVMSGSGNKQVGLEVSNPQQVIINQSGEWSDAQDQLAKDECIKGFFADLITLTEKATLVILLDTYDQVRGELKAWVDEEFLLPLCLDMESRPSKLIVVLAGQSLPPLKGMSGGEAKYLQLVKSSPLSKWEDEHIKEFLKVNGYDDLDADEVDFLLKQVKKGKAISKALQLADYIRLNRS